MMSRNKLFLLLSVITYEYPHFVEAQYSRSRGCRLKTEIVQVVQNVTNQSITRRSSVEEIVGGVDNVDFLLETGKLVEYDARECECGGAPANTYCLILQDPGENYCIAKMSYDGPNKDMVPICYRRTILYTFSTMYFIPICIAMTFLVASIVFTQCGQQARNYVLSRCFPSINRRTVDRVLRQEAERRQAFQRAVGMESSLENGTALMDQNGMKRNLSLRLKTKIFQPQSSFTTIEASTEENDSSESQSMEENDSSESQSMEENDNSESQSMEGNRSSESQSTKENGSSESQSTKENGSSESQSTKENSSASNDKETRWLLSWNKHEMDDFGNQQEDEVCTICLAKLEPGDRIGALPCNHSFHVDCLKTWVLWRNTCPLCNAPDIASTHVTMIPQATDEA